jgi:hypothetical protein
MTMAVLLKKGVAGRNLEKLTMAELTPNIACHCQSQTNIQRGLPILMIARLSHMQMKVHQNCPKPDRVCLGRGLPILMIAWLELVWDMENIRGWHL